MTLRQAVKRTIKSSGMRPYTWAQDVADIPKSTFRDLMRDGTCTGRTLAKLQKAGVEVATRKLIDSLASPMAGPSRSTCRRRASAARAGR
jgi:hypothetical protein